MKKKIFGWEVDVPNVNHFTDWSFFNEDILTPSDIGGPMIYGNQKPIFKSRDRHDLDIVQKRKAELRSGEAPLTPEETRYDRNSYRFGGYFG